MKHIFELIKREEIPAIYAVMFLISKGLSKIGMSDYKNVFSF